jgi:hypothetical protein
MQDSFNKSTIRGIKRGKNITSTIQAPGLFVRLRGSGEKIVAQPERKENAIKAKIIFFIVFL